MQHAIYGLKALRELEQRAERSGLALMPRAAAATADWVTARLPGGADILVAAGPGNNGADAMLAAALLLRAGFRVELLLPEQGQGQQWLSALNAWQRTGAPTSTLLASQRPRPDLVIDGLFGIGISRPFSPAWCACIDRLNALGAPILALDTPSGLDPYLGRIHNRAIRASATLTFLCHKPGLFTGVGADLAGAVHLATLDHPDWDDSAQEGALNPAHAAPLQRRPDSHKGSYGSVAIVGGAMGMLGAALLSGRAALRAGAGKVWVCALDARLAVDTQNPELMLRDCDSIPDSCVLAIGPGLGQQARSLALLTQMLGRADPLVLDADALNLLAREPGLQHILTARQAPAILTPHPAEAGRLLGISSTEVQNDRIRAARALARRYHAVVVLKGAGSLIVRPDGFYHLNTSGGPALAAAGQGDVLTGLIAALLAQGLNDFDAASLAVKAHSLTADEYVRASGGPIGLAASASAEALAGILNRLLPVGASLS